MSMFGFGSSKPKDTSLYYGSPVIELTDKDFKLGAGDGDAKLISGGPGLIKFYASWCPHCRNKQETYKELGSVLNNGSSTGYNIYAVNTSDPKTRSVCKKLGIQGIPAFHESQADGSLKPFKGAFGKEAVMARAQTVIGGQSGGGIRQSGGGRGGRGIRQQSAGGRGLYYLELPKLCCGKTCNGGQCSRLVHGRRKYCWQHTRRHGRR